MSDEKQEAPSEETKLPRQAYKLKPEKKKEIFIFLSLAGFIFFFSLLALGTLVYSIKKYNPLHTQQEVQEIINMDYDEMQKASYHPN